MYRTEGSVQSCRRCTELKGMYRAAGGVQSFRGCIELKGIYRAAGDVQSCRVASAVSVYLATTCLPTETPRLRKPCFFVLVSVRR